MRKRSKSGQSKTSKSESTASSESSHKSDKDTSLDNTESYIDKNINITRPLEKLNKDKDIDTNSYKEELDKDKDLNKIKLDTAKVKRFLYLSETSNEH